NSDIVINEIGAYPTSTHEWIEIWNKGNEPIDLTGWKFWEEGSNHGLSASTTDAIVEPGEYGAICQNEEQFLLDFPSFSGSIFDSSWSGLSENGEEIGLKDAEGEMLELFTYLPTSDFSLERRDPFLADYSSANWQEHTTGNTLGFVNSFFGLDPPPPEEDSSILWSFVKINEFVSDPAEGNEWVELYNTATSSVSLAGGYLCDSRDTTSTYKSLTGTIQAGEWFLFELGSAYLNNGGDSVILKNVNGEIVDSVVYSGELAPEKGQSLARRTDGADTDSNADWAITTNITAGSANVIVAPVVPPSGGGGSSYSPSIVEQEESLPTFSSSPIILNEIYPYPDEDEEEFIEIKSTAESAVSLIGWKIGDKVKNFGLSGSIAPGEIKYFDKTSTGIALNNSTAEEVKLLGPQGQIFELIRYDSAKKGLSYSRDVSSTWKWTTKITRGDENEFVEPVVEVEEAKEIGLLWRVKYRPLIRQGEEIDFDVSRTLDPRGGRIAYAWDFDEGKILAGEKASYIFVSSGIHNVYLSATSSAGTIDVKKIKLNVFPMNEPLGTGIIISEIAPNESEGEEYIAIKNIGATSTNISNWKIVANDKIYNIPTGTIIMAQDNAVYHKDITKFTLTNTGGQIELRRDDDVLIDSADYGKAKAGEKFVFVGDEWVLVKGVLESKVEATSVATTKAVKKTNAVNYVSSLASGIAGARELEKGTITMVRGMVAILPGIFGVQFFYIVDADSGIQVYNYKKEFPAMKMGDLVEVQGEISEASGAKRIKSSSIKILGKGIISAVEMTPEELAPENAGGLIKIAGEITEIKSNYFYLDNGAVEIKVYLKSNAKIDKTKFKEGELAEVTGIVEMSKTEIQVWPRSQDDIVVTGKSKDLLKKEGVTAKPEAGDTAEKYLTATAGGITTLVLGFLLKARGAFVRGLLGRGGALIAGLVRRDKV
ncbi:MAG: lamin tail domain-containing protein, partial [bacterium]